MIFITGGTGLVGARLIFDLVNLGQNIIALKRPDTPIKKFSLLLSHYTSNVAGIEKKVTWVDGDLTDFESLMQLIPSQAEVYHCAAMVSFNPKFSRNIFETNVEGTANLINACLAKEIKKFCHVSSIGALGGKVNGLIIDEETPWSASGKSAYSLSKYYAELEVWRGMAEGLNAVIVNPAVILGAGDWDNGSPQLFSLVSKGMKYYTNGTTSYVDVRDVTKAMIELMHTDIRGERFILASETCTYKKLFELIAESIHAKSPTKYANKFLTAMAYKAVGLWSFFSGKEPRITRQTHKIAHAYDVYSGKKIKEKLNFTYTPINETIQYIANCFIKSHNKF